MTRLGGYEQPQVVQAVVPAVPHNLPQALAPLGGEEDRLGQVVLLVVDVEPLSQGLVGLLSVVLDSHLPQEQVIEPRRLTFYEKIQRYDQDYGALPPLREFRRRCVYHLWDTPRRT